MLTDSNLESVEVAVRGFFDHGSELEPNVSLTKKPYRGNKGQGQGDPH